MRLAWLTDIHLDFLNPPQTAAFYSMVRAAAPDAVLISGDIGIASILRPRLLAMAAVVGSPVYFVLGNHDFYESDVETVRDDMRALTRNNDSLFWLPEAGLIPLGIDACLIGHDGWSDGQYGDFMASSVLLQDYFLIESLMDLSQPERLAQLKALGDEAADYLRGLLPQAARFRQVVVATHAPPFVEACWHEGRTPALDDAYLPHFTCKAVGDALLQAADTYPAVTFTVLCGHTHGGGTARLRPNLTVITGPAEYGQPVIQQVFEFP